MPSYRRHLDCLRPELIAYFHVFNEAHTIVYELIVAGAVVGEKAVVDISIGQHWGRL